MIPRYARWTDDEVAELRRLFPDHTAREISERTGRVVALPHPGRAAVFGVEVCRA